MDLSNEDLKKLAIEAQNHSRKSAKRQVALGKLWNAIYQSHQLYRPKKTRIPPSLNYEEVYDEALANLQLYICEKIDDYKPTRAEVIAWVNFMLETRFVGDAIRQLLKEDSRREPRPKLADLDDFSNFDLDDLAPKVKPPCLSERVRQCLQDDPDNFFKTTHIEGCPNANFKAIALLYIDGVSWQDISLEVGVKSVQTLSGFFQRCQKRFAGKIKEYIEE